MKILTIILIILFLSVVIFFGVMLIKKSANDKKVTSETTLESISETTSSTGETTPLTETAATTSTETTTPETTAAASENITEVEIYLDGDKANGIFLGKAEYNLPSADAELIYGKDFSNSGFKLKFDNKDFNFEPGTVHNLYIYTLIPAYGWEFIKEEIMVPGNPVTADSIRMSVDSITDNSTLTADSLKNLVISGWAADTSVKENTGINKVEVYLDGPRNFGKLLGEAQYGLERVDVGAAYGNANYNKSGYMLTYDASKLEPGSLHKIYVYAYSPNGTHQYLTRNIIIQGQLKESDAIVSADATFNTGSIEVTGWAVNKNFVEKGIPRALDVEYSIKKIVFVSNKSGNEDIWSMNLDGSELTQLTNDPGIDQYPAVSPDGKKIAYSAGSVWQIWVMNWDGSDKKQITFEPTRHGYPTWSFDGKYIFFEMWVDENWEIYRMDSDGRNMKRLTFNPGIEDWHPSAHPFEYKVLYETGALGEGGIYIIDYNGKNMKKITKPDRNYRVPKMSIDGKKIAFQSYSSDKKYDVFIMDSNGKNVVQLTNTPENAGLPCFSPDNKFIAYGQTIGGNQEIYMMNIDGSNQTRLTNITGDDWGPAFIFQVKQ
jgi:TolB protein